MIRVIAGIAVLLSSTGFLHAQTECTRSMLQKAAASYIAAQEAGDMSKMSLAPDAKFQQDMSEIAGDKGLWNTALPIALHNSIYDVGRCKTFSEVIVAEGGHPYVIGTRLTVKDGKIAEIDSLVTHSERAGALRSASLAGACASCRGRRSHSTLRKWVGRPIKGNAGFPRRRRPSSF